MGGTLAGTARELAWLAQQAVEQAERELAAEAPEALARYEAAVATRAAAQQLVRATEERAMWATPPQHAFYDMPRALVLA